MRLHISLQENCFCFGKTRFSISYLKLGDSENRSDISVICKASVVFKVHTSYYLCNQGVKKLSFLTFMTVLRHCLIKHLIQNSNGGNSSCYSVLKKISF